MLPEQNIRSAKLSASAFLALLVAIGILRAVPLVIWFDDLRQDHDAYIALAEGWAASGTFGRLPDSGSGGQSVAPTAYRPPLYPLILSWLTRHDFSQVSDTSPLGAIKLSFPAVAILHWLLGVATCIMTIRIADSIQQNKYLSMLAGLLVAVDPILVRQSTLVMTETLATFLALAFWLWWVSDRPHNIWQSVLGGVLLGLSVLCRPTAAIWCVLLVLWISYRLYRGRWDTARVSPLALVIGICISLSPWIIRNYVQFAKPIWATTHGGYTLLLANNEILYDHFEAGHVSRNWDEQRFHDTWAKRFESNPLNSDYWNQPGGPQPTAVVGKINELEDDRLANQCAWATIRNHPAIFLESILVRAGWLWALWPAGNQASSVQQLVIGGWYALVFLLLLATGIACGLYRREQLKRIWPALAPGILLVVALTVVHAVYWSNMRMRAVAMPTVYVCLAASLAALRRDAADEV